MGIDNKMISQKLGFVRDAANIAKPMYKTIDHKPGFANWTI